MRLACLADGFECQEGSNLDGTVAAPIEMDELGPERAELARRLEHSGIPLLVVAEDPHKRTHRRFGRTTLP